MGRNVAISKGLGKITLKVSGVSYTDAFSQLLDLPGADVTHASDIDQLLDALDTISIVSGDVKFALSTWRAYKITKLDPVVDGLRNTESAGKAISAVGSTGAKIPVAVVKKPAKLVKVAGDFLASFGDKAYKPANTAQEQLDALTNKLAVLETALTATQVLSSGLKAALTKVKEKALEAQAADTFSAEFYKDLASKTGGVDSLTAEDVEVILDDRIADEFEAAYGAFQQRIGQETSWVIDAYNTATVISQTLEKPGKFIASVRTAVTTITNALEAFDIVDDIQALTDIATALGDAARVLTDILSVVQPVLDFFGPVLTIIDAIIDGISEAVGLNALQDALESEIISGLNQLLGPIVSELATLLFALDDDAFEDLANLIDGYSLLGQQFGKIIYNPLIEMDDPTLDEALGDKAIIFSSGGNDVATLEADFHVFSQPTDPYGGYFLGANGNKTVTGMYLGDLIVTGEGDDSVNGLAR